MLKNRFLLALPAASLAAAAHAQIVVGQIDTFNSSTAGWQGASPLWVAGGGPGGAADAFMQLTSTGGAGAGGRMAAYNGIQWSGNYTAAGVTGIDLDFRNLGANPLEMRLTLFDSTLATQWVSTNSYSLAVGSAWQHAIFSLVPGNFVQVAGTATFAQTMAGVGRLMFRHDPAPPSSTGVPIVATLGVDNVRALPVPEPATLGVVGLGLLFLRRRRRQG